MGFNSINALFVTSLTDELQKYPRAVELGNQRFRPSDEVLKRIIDYAEGELENADIGALRDLMALSPKGREPLTAKFFSALGYESYIAIDTNDKFGSIPMDLNKSLRRDYGYTDTYDLVINNGTGEHIFDQRAVFENMHDLCAPGGLMHNILPFANFLNHGFYNFHPTLFCDLAAANDYRIRAIGIGNNWGTLGFLTGSIGGGLLEAEEIPIELFRKPIEGRAPWGRPPLRWVRLLFDRFGYYDTPARRLDKAIERVMRDSMRRRSLDFGNVLIIAVMQKTTDQPFRIPMQGRFVPSIDDDAIARAYDAQTGDRHRHGHDSTLVREDLSS